KRRPHAPSCAGDARHHVAAAASVERDGCGSSGCVTALNGLGWRLKTLPLLAAGKGARKGGSDQGSTHTMPHDASLRGLRVGNLARRDTPVLERPLALVAKYGRQDAFHHRDRSATPPPSRYAMDRAAT